AAWPVSRRKRSGGAAAGRSRRLFFLARDADARPGNRVQPGLGDRLAAIAAHAVRTLLDAPQRFLDRLQNLRVGLLQLELNVHFVVAARLIRHVALARVVLHRRLQRLDAAGAEDLGPFPEERVLV